MTSMDMTHLFCNVTRWDDAGTVQDEWLMAANDNSHNISPTPRVVLFQLKSIKSTMKFTAATIASALYLASAPLGVSGKLFLFSGWRN
jgi:hypothetical protein